MIKLIICGIEVERIRNQEWSLNYSYSLIIKVEVVIKPVCLMVRVAFEE